jgi:hypothetical protein
VTAHSTWRSREATRIISEYHQAGNHFDGLYRSLLPQLRENRRRDPSAGQTDGLLSAVQRVTGNRFPAPVMPWPYLTVDTETLLSYARLDNQTVGTAVIDAVTDTSCRILVSPLTYLSAAGQTYGTPAYGRLQRLVADPAGPEAEPLVTIPDLDLTAIIAIPGLDAEDRPDVVHTALLALTYRCVVGTLYPGRYHRLGYLRTVDLA